MFLSWDNLIPLAAFLAITLGVWAILSLLADRPTTAEGRLRRLLNPNAPGFDSSALARRQDVLQAKVSAAAARLGKSLRPSDEAEIGKVRVMLLNAGFRGENAVSLYYSLKVLAMLAGAAIASPLVVSRYGLSQTGITYLILAAGFGFYLPGIIVGQIKKRRCQEIFLGLPDALDLMVVCIEAGLGLDTTLQRVTSELATTCPALCDEFGIANFQVRMGRPRKDVLRDLMVVCIEAGLGLDATLQRVTSELATSCPALCSEFEIANFQVRMGRPRKDVLRDLGIRTGVDDMRTLAAVVIQAERFGSSIGAALRVQSDSMRLRRRQLAEERAAKTAVKIMIPLILFIFPGIFVVLVGPAGIQIATTMIGH